MNIFHQRFQTNQVILASGVPNATLQSWLKRGLVIGHRDIEGGGSPGSHRQFAFVSVMELALAKALIDEAKVSTSVALNASQRFSHIASGPVGNQPGRIPGVPYDSRNGCSTLLCAAGDRIITYRLAENENSAISNISERLGNPGAFAVVAVDPIFERVVAVLGHDYRNVLAMAYGEET